MLEPNPDHRTDDITPNPNDPPVPEGPSDLLDFCVYCQFEVLQLCIDPSNCSKRKTRFIMDMM